MKRFLQLFTFLAPMCFAMHGTAFDQSSTSEPHFTGTWKNQYGSTLTLESSGDNLFTGTFTTAVANTQSCIGKAVPLQGVNNGNAIAISMSLESCGSPVTVAIVGSLQEDENHQETLTTMDLVQWQGKTTWKSKVISTETFVRVEK